MNACDFHTHHLSGARPELLSAQQRIGSVHTSLEFHPWDLPAEFDPSGFELLIKALPEFTALGEVGLDRLRGPALDVQMKYLKYFLEQASSCRKPVIIHVVKAWTELFSIMADFPDIRWAVHGFRHSPELLDELWKRDVTVSFHRSIVQNPALSAKLKKPEGKIAFESDDLAGCPLEDIVAETMKNSGNPDLLKLSTAAFMEFVEHE